MTAKPKARSGSTARSAARLAAVQALYQHEMEGTLLPILLDEFHRHRLGAEIEDMQFHAAETAFFDDVVRHTLARRDEIDALVSGKLAENWKLERLDKTMLQILRAGAYELMARADVPTRPARSAPAARGRRRRRASARAARPGGSRS